MKKLENQQEFDLLQNEFMVNQEQVKNQIRSVQKQRNFALIFAALIVIASMVVVVISLNIASASKRIDKVVYREDGSGVLLMGMVSSGLNVKKTTYIKNQLSEYVRALYSIPSDKNQRQYNASKVQYMTSVDYYSQYPQLVFQDSFIKHGTELVSANIQTSGQVSPGVWSIEWSKTLNGTKIADYKTMITFKQVDISNAGTEIDLYNPLGIAVTNIDTQERISQ